MSEICEHGTWEDDCGYCLRAKIQQLERENSEQYAKMLKEQRRLDAGWHEANIEIAKLQAENERLCEEIEFDKALDTKIIKDQARKEGRMEAAREIVEYIEAKGLYQIHRDTKRCLLFYIKSKFGLEG